MGGRKKRELTAEIVAKTCVACGESKPLERFTPTAGGLYGLKSRCKPCASVQSNAYRKAHRDAHLAYNARWRERNPEAAWRLHLKKEYGITPDEYTRMAAAQDGRCAICGVVPPGKPLVVDHCHTTGEVRALLCDYCNWGLGSFRDDPRRMRAAADYLERFSERVEQRA